jgi:hypothetical protein
MTENNLPNRTPNVVIENPAVRKVVRTVLDSIGGLVFIASAVDVASPVFDISGFTGPALAGYAVARVVFGFAVDSPNTPKPIG